MKKLLITGITLLYCCLTNAQDTIVKRNGDQLLSKILEISATEVKYKKFDFQDGPDFIDSKSDIRLIKYSNGSKDEFELQPTNNVVNPKGNNTDYYTGPVNQTYKIETHGNSFRYKEKKINERELHWILLNSSDPQITQLTNNARRYKKLQFVGLGGIILAVGGLGSIALGDLINEPAFGIFGGACLITAVAFPIAALNFKNKRNVSNREAIELYNSKK
jgi:hypothetical protein